MKHTTPTARSIQRLPTTPVSPAPGARQCLAGLAVLAALSAGCSTLEPPAMSTREAQVPPANTKPVLPAYPVAEVGTVEDMLHGTRVPDPYRWLEDARSAPAQAWFKGQADVARTVLERIDGRDAIAARLAELADGQGDSIRGVVRMPGERYYYMKRSPGERQFKLVMRTGLTGPEQLLVDPEMQSRRSGVPHAVNYYRPSWDGRFLVYGLSAGGSENASLYLQEIVSGRVIGQPVPRTPEADVNWLPDSRSFTYTQLAERAPGASDQETYMDARVMWQRIGGGAPQAVFGPTVTPELKLARLDVATLTTVPGSRWVFARTTDTTVPEGNLFVGPVAQLGRPGMRWQRVASAADKVVSVALQGDGLFVMTQAGAPRRRIVRVDLARPGPKTLARAALVVAEPRDAVLEEFELTPGGLVAEVRQGTAVVLRRHARGDTAGRTLPPPAPGTARPVSSPAGDTDNLLYAFSGWAEPARWYRLDGERSVEVSLGNRSVPPGLPEIVVTEALVPSHDGVVVPMTVLHRKGLVLDGSNPVLLNGYASYGFSMSAGYSSESMAWMERGGVVAMANPRGSGVYGDTWHRAGFKATKPNTWKDGIACARWLIAQGYGSARTMGISGTSAGGIFVGRAVTEAPELFAAAIFNVGVMDAVRAEESANGITNISEFGSARDAAEFKGLLEMSTYHQIRDRTAYPGVLLVHGMNDPRVDVWHSGKTAARLQAAQAAMPDARPTLLRLDMQAGHGMGSTVAQRQAMAADMQAFLLWQMGKLKLKD